MRITKEAKEKNWNIILENAERLFALKGYEETTTRDISLACGMAKGTLFNYFKSKETLAMTLISRAMEAGREKFRQRRTGREGVNEELFLLIACELRALRPYRSYIGPVLEGAMSIFAKTTKCLEGETARLAHLKSVKELLSHYGFDLTQSSIAVTLYWSLYLGILAHWSHDPSENQGETLTLLDYSIQIFTNTIAGNIEIPGVAYNG